jgi:hypothetical protein
LVETVEETTPIYKFGAITEQDPVITYSEWQVQETNAIAPDVSSETTTETDNAGAVYEVVTTTTTPTHRADFGQRQNSFSVQHTIKKNV